MALSIHQLRSAAIAAFEVAATKTDALVFDDGFGARPESQQIRDTFVGSLRDSKVPKRIMQFNGKHSNKFPGRVLDIMLSAYRVRRTWADEIKEWNRNDALGYLSKRVHAKASIAAFLRAYIQKPSEDLALAANWYIQLGLSDSDVDEEKAPPAPRINVAKRDNADEELRIVLACVPADILAAAYSHAAPDAQERASQYSTFYEELYRSRRHVDQSNVLCWLDQQRGAATQTLPSQQRFFGPDVLQLIARMACNTKGKPLPVRAPRLLDTGAVKAALQEVVNHIGALNMTRDATRVCLKRILDAIPAPSGAAATASSAALPPKKKARQATPRRGRGAAAAAAAAAAMPSSDESDEEEED